MPYWYFEKEELKNTPSKRDGIDQETERRYRCEAAQFIRECGNLMSLGYSTIHTASVYLHRFYMYYSFKHFPRYVVACSCLFLAGKVEETPKKCRDIIKKASDLLSPNNMASFGEDPKEEVLTVERILLKTIKFDLQVDHPYRFLIEYAKCLKSNGTVPKEQVVQKAWNFINDSLATTLCLQWEPEIIAVAMVYLASKISKYDVIDWKGRTPDQQKWWDMFVKDMTKTILDDICHQVLDLYQKNKVEPVGSSSPPQLPASKTYKYGKTSSPPPPLPAAKRPKLESPGTSMKVTGNHQQIPVKVSSNEYDMSKVMPPGIHHPYGYPSTSYQPIPSYVPPSAPIPPPLPTQPNHHPKPPLPQQPPLPSSHTIYQNNMNHASRYQNSNQFYNQPPPPTNNYPPHKNNRSNYYH